jgi:hypothetical protein
MTDSPGDDYQEAARRRDLALDLLDELEQLAAPQAIDAWTRHLSHINTEGNVGPCCTFCQIRVDLDFSRSDA